MGFSFIGEIDWCNMKFSRALLVLFCVIASEAVAKSSTVSPTLSYWHHKLPTTPLPSSLRELISPLSSSELLADMKQEDGEESKASVSVGKGGVNVGVGKAKPKPSPSPNPKPKPNPKAPVTRNPSPGKGGVGVSVGKGGVSVGKKPGKGTGVHVGDSSPFNYNYAASDDEILRDPSLSSMFLLEKDLQSGSKVNLQFLERSSSPADGRVFSLPRSLADAIPFSSQKLSIALEKLNISQGSNKALAMEQTLEECESPAIRGENKYCATSLESMIDYSTSTLGTNDVNVFATDVGKGQQYTITGFPFRSTAGSKSVACHKKSYAYAVYYCHETEHTNTALVSLKGENGNSGEGVAVCHADTSGWNPQHLAFKVLNVKPGGAPVCHFIPNDHIVWLPAN